jgi:hypothetical protein
MGTVQETVMPSVACHNAQVAASLLIGRDDDSHVIVQRNELPETALLKAGRYGIMEAARRVL